MNYRSDKIRRWDWVFLAPLAAACILVFFRFPLLQNDDHLEVVRYIADSRAWPPIVADASNQARHTLVHHTLGAVTYTALKNFTGPVSLLGERSVQALSLIYALGIILLVWKIGRLMINNDEARVLSFLIFGTFTGWVTSAVTIDNDMAMGFWGSLALLIVIGMMRKKAPPSWRLVAGTGLVIGLAVLMKATASVMMGPAVICLLARRWYYRERWMVLLPRIGLLIIIWAVMAAPNYIRTYQDTGYLVYHNDIQHPNPSVHAEHWDYFSFRLPSIIKRPFELNPDKGDDRTNKADYSFWSKIYLTWWRLPDWLPDDPNQWAASMLYLAALPISLCGLIGFILGIIRCRRDPSWLPVMGWWVIGLIGMFIGSWFLPTVAIGSFCHPRFYIYATGSVIVMLGLGFQFLINRWPRLQIILWILVLLQTATFWWLLLSGPYYSFQDPWPVMMSP